MAEDDVDDLFKDFEQKVEDKKEHPKVHTKDLNDDDLKNKYQKAEEALKKKYAKERQELEEEKAKEMLKHGKIPTKHLENVERVAYVAVILVLVAYIFIDLSLEQRTTELETEPTAAAVTDVAEEENETVEAEEEVEEVVEEETEVEEEAEVEEPVLSGKITLTIDKIYTEVDEQDDDLGELSKVDFTIDNGKDKFLIPVLEIFAYDEENIEDYETKSRGQYYGLSIQPGDTHTGTISLTPKMWRDLHLKKNIRLVLNDTEDGFITAVNTVVYIS